MLIMLALPGNSDNLSAKHRVPSSDSKCRVSSKRWNTSTAQTIIVDIQQKKHLIRIKRKIITSVEPVLGLGVSTGPGQTTVTLIPLRQSCTGKRIR